MLRQTLQPVSRPRCLPKVHSLSNARLNHGRGKSVGRRFNTWSESWFLSFSVHPFWLQDAAGKGARPRRKTAHLGRKQRLMFFVCSLKSLRPSRLGLMDPVTLQGEGDSLP